ncbi:kinase-like protein [Neocallimastix lanati (nom. inval.)]|nr:kinase-like protein [Neocallimastix sp. JGI-2020a]
MGNTFGKSDSTDFNGEVELRHFNLLRCIGKGAFGKVRIVEHKEKKKLYALKYINKMQCIKMKAIQNIMRERSILEEIEHPFIVNLRFAFQDDENMFMVLDLMIGGDLRFHLERLGGFTEETLRFYCAEIACALNYLHNKGIIHRDIKPDNILLDDKGHAHITDFNIAVHIDPKRLPRSQSGTISYMAPEVFAGKGYSYPIDWWSLGIVLFEGFYGKRPFKGHNNEQVSNNIVNQKDIHFPSTNSLTKHPVKPSAEFLSIMNSFLIKDPNNRLGCSSKGLDELWDNTWFRGIDWDKLERKEYVSPMIPNPDKANFDATYDLEELLLEDNPLTYRPRKKKNKNKDNSEDSGHGKGFFGGKSNSSTQQPKSRLQTELEYIEDHFKTYDCTLFDRFTQLMENDKLLENPELMKILDEEFKNLSQQSEMPMKRPNNTHGPSGAITEKLIKEKQIRLQAYHARMQLRQQENQLLQQPGQTYNSNRNILQHNMMAGSSNFYNNNGSNSSLYGSGYNEGGNSNRSSPNNTHYNLHEDIHNYKNNSHYPMTPQYNASTPPQSQATLPVQPLPPTPEPNYYTNSNNSTGRLEMSSGNLSRNEPSTSSLNRRNKNKKYGSNGSTGINTPSDSPKIGGGASYTQQLTSNGDRERERIRQNQQLKQKLTSSPQTYHQKLVPNRKLSQNHLNHSANSDSINSLQLSNLKEDHSGDYNLNISRSMNNLNYSTHSNDDMIKNILSKDEMEELNDDFLFDRKNVFSKPMYHSTSMDELNQNMGKGYNKVPNPKGLKQGVLNMTALSGGVKKDDEKIMPFNTNEEIQGIGNLYDNLSISDSNIGYKKLRHGKSYDNLTAKKYNRSNEVPPPLPNSSSTGKINYIMKYDFPIPPSNGAPSNRPYVTPSKSKGSSGY